MAAYVQGVHNNSSVSGTHSVATAAPVVGNILVVVTYDTGTTANSTVTDDQGGTYTRVASALKASSADIMGFYVRDQLISNTNVHTVQSAPGTTSGGGLQVYEFSGISKTGARAVRTIAGVAQIGKQENQGAATPAPALPANALTANPTILAVMNATNTATLTEPTGWAERRDSGYNNPTTGFESATRNSGFTGTTATYASSSSAFCSLIVELDIQSDQTATPGVLSLTTTAFAPTVTKTNNQRVTAGLLALTTTRYAPVIKLQVTPPTKALTTATFAPTVSTPRLATPSTKALTLTKFAPTVSAPRLVTPGVRALTITPLTPTVALPVLVTPGPRSAVLTAFAPAVALPVAVVPSTAPLLTDLKTPTVTATDFQEVVPGTASLSLTTFAPDVAATANQRAIPDTAALVTTGQAPTVPISDEQIAQPATAALTLTTYPPTVTSIAALVVVPSTAPLSITRFAPTVTKSAHRRVVPNTAALHLSPKKPNVKTTQPAKRVLMAGLPMRRKEPYAPILVEPEPTHLHLVTKRPHVIVIDDGDILDILRLIA